MEASQHGCSAPPGRAGCSTASLMRRRHGRLCVCANCRRPTACRRPFSPSGIFQSCGEREGPHRGGDDHRDGEGGIDQRRDRADRADLGQYRIGARLRCSLARLSAEARDAGLDVDRAAPRCWRSWRRDRADAGRPRHEGGDCDRRGTDPHDAEFRDAAAVQEPRQSEIHRRTTAEEIWNAPAAISTSLSRASAPAAPSPAWARCSRPRKPSLRVVAVEPEESPVLSGDSIARTRSRASAPASFPTF